MKSVRTMVAGVAVLMMMLDNSTGETAEARTVPEGFRQVGLYRLTQRVKVREGVAMEVTIRPVDYQVYTDGITIRCYGADSEAYTSFEIYRRDGMTITRPGGLIETVPGVQASSLVGDSLRQMSLSEDQLVLSRFPGLSNTVEITYAKRVAGEDYR
jgi:hypothetical protein